MSYRKTANIRGNDNQANESLSHNRVVIDTGAGVSIAVIYAITLITAGIVFVAFVAGEMLKYAVIASIFSAFLGGWILLLQFTRRSISKTQTIVLLDEQARKRALLEANIAYAGENYILYRNEEGILTFRGAVMVQENRHYPALEAPKQEVNQSEGILEFWDLGMSARSIEKLMKEKEVSYRDITKTLDLYRQGWNKKGKANIVDADEEE